MNTKLITCSLSTSLARNGGFSLAFGKKPAKNTLNFWRGAVREEGVLTVNWRCGDFLIETGRSRFWLGFQVQNEFVKKWCVPLVCMMKYKLMRMHNNNVILAKSVHTNGP